MAALLAVSGGACETRTTSDQGIPAKSRPRSTPTTSRFSFVVLGDTQLATSSCTSGVPERLAIPRVIRSLRPDFVLHTGDLMDHGYEPGAYARFFTCYAEVLEEIPLFPTIGNHDAGRGGIKRYRGFLDHLLLSHNPRVKGPDYHEAFDVSYGDDPTPCSQSFKRPGARDDVPSGVCFKTFYAFRHGNAYFLSFEQGTKWWSNTPRSWVKKHLSRARADRRIQHIFVYMHHPIYSSTIDEIGPSAAVAPVRKHYELLFREHDVTMVFSGHAHLYDRYYVPDDGRVTRREPPPRSYPDLRATHYIVTGGGGGPLKNCAVFKKERSFRFFQRRACVHHLVQVRVAGSRLRVRAIAVEGSASRHTTRVIDELLIGPARRSDF